MSGAGQPALFVAEIAVQADAFWGCPRGHRAAKAHDKAAVVAPAGCDLAPDFSAQLLFASVRQQVNGIQVPEQGSSTLDCL